MDQVPVTLITVCSVCEREIRRVDTHWGEDVYRAAVARVGHGSPFLSHGVCPGGNACERYVRREEIGEE
jgi:hypothetical protein